MNEEKNDNWFKKNWKNLLSGLNIVVIIGVFIFVGRIIEWKSNLNDEIKDIGQDMKDVRELIGKFSSIEGEMDKLDENIIYLNKDIQDIKGIIFGHIKYYGGMGGGEFEEVKLYKGTVGFISSKSGSITYSGISYNPFEKVAAINKASELSKDILIQQELRVMRSEYADDFKGGSFTGPSVIVKVIDVFYDYNHPQRYLLLSEAASSEIGLTKEKGLMKVIITKVEDINKTKE
jgi:hypothetical protein